MSKKNAVVTIYNTHTKAEAAIKDFQKAGFDMKKLSIVGKDGKDYYTEEDVAGYYTTGDRMKYWGKLGAFWGGLWGFLFGAGFFLIPGFGPIVAAGPLVPGIVGAIDGTVAMDGFSALGAGLYSIGISQDNIIKYETAIKSGKYLLIANGTVDEIADQGNCR